MTRVRAVCEHAFAPLKNWRILTRFRHDVSGEQFRVRAGGHLTSSI
ncbi:hypothetical protein [Streptomyces bluensis]